MQEKLLPGARGRLRLGTRGRVLQALPLQEEPTMANPLLWFQKVSCISLRMDPNTCYELKIKLLGNRKKARKDVGCWSIEKFVDSDLINIKDLVESVIAECPSGYLEVAHIQYYDTAMKTFREVISDQDLMSTFAKHKTTKVVTMFIQYCDASEPFVPITEWEIDEQMHQANNTEVDDDEYLRNPLPENGHVGVDDEAIDYVPEDDSEDGSEDEDELDVEVEKEDELVGHEATHIPNIEYDKEDPPMTEGSTYPSMKEFKLALCMHAIKHEFEFKTDKSSQHRFRVHCSRKAIDKCPWKIYASTTDDQRTVKVRKNRWAHACSSTWRKKKVKNATKHWICEKVKDFLIDDATLKVKALQKKIKERYGVHIHYKRVYMGRILALSQLYGDWDRSFDNLYRFKAQIESCSLGSVVNIDHHTINGKTRFRRMFFALKPCLDGFLNGCRPYLAVDSTFLTGRFKGQLATASAVDGHNWLFPVCFGVFDSETNENWIWFMNQVRQAIGCPRGLAIHTDAGQAVMKGVGEVFPEAEKRECMFHLVNNFKKQHRGKLFDDHLWAAAYSWNPYLFEKHWAAMEKQKPAATNYLRQFHTRLWTRSQFSPFCKVDYVTNNLAECLNNWLKHHKSLNLDDLMDKIRQLIMIKWNQRRKVTKKWDGRVLPHIIKKLNEQSRELSLEVVECAEAVVAEVTAMGGSGFRFVVNLEEKTCTCGKWQVCGIPYKYALAFITSLPNVSIENYVHEFYYIDKFRALIINSFLLCLIKASGQNLLMRPPKKKAKITQSAQSSIVPFEDDAPAASMSFPPSQSLETTSKTKESHDKSNSGPSKRRMSRSGSNQPEPITSDRPPLNKKAKAKRKKKETPKAPIPMLPFDSPPMGTRSKRLDPASPAMSTRSKRRLSLPRR
ncbi:hypothetical protein U9M48_034399 [Paspalum notatum var. saurae]|uniref:Zinc finger PMZ-type domain-containing protein n=1 Tax=Paspalum notatum var. saurae TaxID=547442 RepID=A0AAQ3X6R6_PASNO